MVTGPRMHSAIIVQTMQPYCSMKPTTVWVSIVPMRVIQLAASWTWPCRKSAMPRSTLRKQPDRPPRKVTVSCSIVPYGQDELSCVRACKATSADQENLAKAPKAQSGFSPAIKARTAVFLVFNSIAHTRLSNPLIAAPRQPTPEPCQQ